MKIHFFVSNRSCNTWYSAKIAALLEEDYTDREGTQAKSFKYLEQISLHMTKDLDKYHSIKFDHDCSKNSCYGHFAKSRKELYKAMDEDHYEKFKPVSKRDYFRFRKVVLGLYHRQQLIDFSSFAGEQTYSVRQIL